jgi:glycosyltransferase involved in cell wall biosynthesis
MKVVHLSYSDLGGGAARVAYHLHRSLRAAEVDSRMLVLDRRSNDPDVARAVGEGLPSRIGFFAARAAGARLDSWLNPRFNFSAALIGVPSSGWTDAVLEADVIHAHFTSRLLSNRQWRWIVRNARAPIVWHAHDFERFMGGCHYPGACVRWRTDCRSCPHSRRLFGLDIAPMGQRARQAILSGGKHHVVSHSNWESEILKNCRLSADLQHSLIPMAVDDTLFRPIEKESARKVLGLPRDGKVVFAMAADFNDPRKGGAHLLAALSKSWDIVAGSGKKDFHPRLLTAGSVDIAKNHGLPWPATHLGTINDDRFLAAAYAAADVFVCPSQEDNGPMTVIESLLCGTPVVATRCGVAPDVLQDGENGFVVPLDSPSDMAERIVDVLTHHSPNVLRRAARDRAVARHGYARVSADFVRLYESLLAR